MSDWKPIETAPMDGTKIRLGHEQDVSSMKDGSLGNVFGSWGERGWAISSFFVIPGGRYGLMSNAPTHWKPLTPVTPTGNPSSGTTAPHNNPGLGVAGEGGAEQ